MSDLWNAGRSQITYAARSEISKVTSVLGVSGFGVILAVRSYAVDMIDMQSRALIHTFKQGEPSQAKEFAQDSSLQRRVVTVVLLPCTHSPSCIQKRKLEFHYANVSTRQDTELTICLRPSSENNTLACQGLKNATESRHWLESRALGSNTCTICHWVRKRYSHPCPHRPRLAPR